MAYINLLQVIYPIGSFYFSRNSTSPASIIGGSWTQVTNAALRGSGSVGYTGSDTHTITEGEMPKHRHVDNSRVWWDNNPGGGQTVSYSSSTNFKVDGNTIYTGYVGGGGQCLLSNALTTVICGTELLNHFFSLGGDIDGIR